MISRHSLLQVAGLLGVIVIAIWAFTQQQFNWLLYVGFVLMITGTTYNMFQNWRNGKRTVVFIQLAVLLLAIVYLVIQFS
jgi:uncharacterized membrane protein